MRAIIPTMLERLSQSDHEELICWASPVPCFGDLRTARVATVGINPSNREFVDAAGSELDGERRRFQTLRSLGLGDWLDADENAIDEIVDSCLEYFFRNPYGGWFNRLNPIVSATGSSYYDRLFPACHLDLLPFATDAKWGTLPPSRKRDILQANADLLSGLIAASRLDLIILNGQSVVTEFVAMTGVGLDSEEMPGWELPRSNGQPVAGIAYSGTCTELDGRELSTPLRILGFNHNIQSSFGVTSGVIQNISAWVKRESRLLEFARTTPPATRRGAHAV